MTRITLHADCGNSPKKEFLKEINVAVVNGNIGFLALDVLEWGKF